MEPRKVIIAGAGGRDFHNFNTHFRGNDAYRVVCFTANQIPGIDDRRYPPELAGTLYPDGIPIFDESDLLKLIADHKANEVLFSYSDVSHQYVMELGSKVMAAGADFRMMGADATMVKAKVPLVSICAVRTGCGKSQTTRFVSDLLHEAGKKVVAIRHPMPYGELSKQKVQRFAELADMDTHDCTIEEREEYEPHIMSGNVVYAGCDYEAIVREAEKEADVILWDGGNNDFSFYKPDLEIVITDPHRVGHELTYYPGLVNLMRAQAIIVGKMDSADPASVEQLKANIASVNPAATVVEADSPVTLDDPEAVKGKRVLVVEDGPTLTHGQMAFGAGVIAAKAAGAAELVDPKPYAVGEIKGVYEKYSHVENLLPAVGYGEQQIADLQATIEATPCDAVIIGTPIDLRQLIKISKPALRVTYDLAERKKGALKELLGKWGIL